MRAIQRMHVDALHEQNYLLNEAFWKSEFVNGKSCEEMKKILKSEFSSKYCSLTINGYSSLLMSILATGISGKNIAMPVTSTCFSILNAVKSSGNNPVFIDVNLEDANMSISSLQNEISNKKIQLIISPNHFGNNSNVNAMKKLGIPVIEDCAQSFFTSTLRKSRADLRVLSFYPTKVINAIDGGAILTNNKKYDSFIRERIYYGNQLKNDGIVRFNFRMPNLHSAVGLGSLSMRKKFKSKFGRIKQIYHSAINDSRINYLGQDSLDNVLHKFVLQFNSSKEVMSFQNFMRGKKIQTSAELLWMEDSNKYPNAKKLIETTCSIPYYYSLSEETCSYICRSLSTFLKKPIG